MIQHLPIHRVYRNPGQPRKVFKKDSLEELAASIKEHGVIQPITVEHIPSKLGDYMIVTGERRWRASKLAAKTTIPAIVQQASNHNGRERLILGIVENVQREDMNPIDEAEAYRILKDVHAMTPGEIARKVGKSASWVNMALQRLQLNPKVIDLIRRDLLSADRRLVSALLSVEDPAAQLGVAERAVEHKMTIVGVVSYAYQISRALQSAKVRRGRKAKSPAMGMARQKYELDIDDETAPPNWTALEQLGTTVPWRVIVESVNRTCAGCELRSMASQEICGRCPAVDMLGHLVRQAETEGV
jgi:ParB family chromosome partitioning protein